MNIGLSYLPLISGLRGIESQANALARLCEGKPPRRMTTAITLVRRWVKIPMEHKPVCKYQYKAKQGGSIGTYSRAGFLVWLNTNFKDKLYRKLLLDQPALAEEFRRQFLEIVGNQYRHLITMSGSGLACCFSRALARGLQELSQEMLGEPLDVTRASATR